MKFGGTSVGNTEIIKNVANIIKSHIKQKPVIVVSAVTKITDKLIKLANECAKGKGDDILLSIKNIHFGILEKLDIDKELLKEDFEELSALAYKIKSEKYIDAKILDFVQSFGEMMSSKIVAAQLNNIGIKARAFNSWDVGFLTTAEFGNAEPIETTYLNLKRNMKKLNVVPVITGFIGKTENGEITTLGRGGSDYSAAIIGSAIGADEIQIWTDVSGIMSADPKIVLDAGTIRQVSFAEASELAYFGAKVLHPKTILPAMRKNIPVRVLNSFNSSDGGTIIINKSERSKQTVKAIACKKNTTLIHIDSKRMLGATGFLARIFNIFEKYGKSVDVISTSEVSVSLTVDNGENVDSIIYELNQFSEVNVAKNKSIICVVGEGMSSSLEIPGRLFTVLGENKIHAEMISMGASEINITFIVDGKDAEKTVSALHREYCG